MNDLKSYVDYVKRLVEERFEILVPEEDSYAKDIFTAMRYSLFAGGKRIRPLLAFLSADICDISHSDILDFACSIEMIHTYSLIHDDLPAMDDDDLRRGKATSHKKFGEGMAILAGDALLTESFRVLSQIKCRDYKSMPKIIKEVSLCSGPYGMVGGQVADLNAEGRSSDEKELAFIHRNKTGRLIECCLVVPALAALSDEKTIEALRTIGKDTGLLFQITDDLLDIDGDINKLGKTPGKDAENKKTTYVSLYGEKETRNMAFELKEKTGKLIKEIGGSEVFLQLIDFIYERDH